MSALRLVVDNTSAATRPIVTEYDGSDRPAHSTTPHNALVNATRRILAGQYKRAFIYDADGLAYAQVSITPSRKRLDIITFKGQKL